MLLNVIRWTLNAHCRQRRPCQFANQPISGFLFDLSIATKLIPWHWLELLAAATSGNIFFLLYFSHARFFYLVQHGSGGESVASAGQAEPGRSWTVQTGGALNFVTQVLQYLATRVRFLELEFKKSSDCTIEYWWGWCRRRTKTGGWEVWGVDDENLVWASSWNLPLLRNQVQPFFEFPHFQLMIVFALATDDVGAIFSPGRRSQLQTTARPIPPCQLRVGTRCSILGKRFFKVQ